MSPHALTEEGSDEYAELDVKTEQLRSLIPDIIYSDRNFGETFYLYYWLKATKYNVEKAEAYIRKVLQWRVEQNYDQALTSALDPFVSKEFICHTEGRTKTGYLSWQAHVGHFRWRHAINNSSHETVVYYWLQMLARAEQQMIECNRNIIKKTGEDPRNWSYKKKSYFILNAQDVPVLECMHPIVIKVGIALVKLAICYFPALEGTVCIINATRGIELFLNIVKPLLKGSNVELEVHGTNEQKWKAALFGITDPSERTPDFGGTKVCSCPHLCDQN